MLQWYALGVRTALHRMGDQSHPLLMYRSTLYSQVWALTQTTLMQHRLQTSTEERHIAAHEIGNIEFFPYQHVQQVISCSYLPTASIPTSSAADRQT